MVSWLALSLVTIVRVKCLTLSADHPDHLKLFRIHVSRTAAGKGRAVLEGVGLTHTVISACFTSNPQNEEEAVQLGLIKWIEGQGEQPPTWAVLLQAMEYAQIAQQDVKGLKKKLGLDKSELFALESTVCTAMLTICMCVCVCVCVCV